MMVSAAVQLDRPEAAPAEDVLLAAKLTVPGLPPWTVSRPRLGRRIAAGTRGPLTLLTGPPGAGKTLALACWAASRPAGQVAWLTVDGYDNQPGRFRGYIQAALRRAGTAAGHPGGAAAGVPGLAADLAALDPPVTLVLDDLHLLTSAAALEQLAYVLKYARPGLHVVAAARTAPGLPLHRYRLAGELTEIRAADLAFTPPEAGLLLARHGLALPAAATAQVTERVAGWAAGLRLAALALDRHPEPGQIISRLGTEESALTSYLADEVLDAQPAAARELLLRTSIAGPVSAGLARELTGDEQAGRTLAALAQDCPFIQPAGHGWYRYQALFADVLALQLRRESPGAVAGLRRQAAGWYQRHGLLAEATRQAAQLGDWPLAARMVVDSLATGQLLRPPGHSPVAAALRPMRGPLPGAPVPPPGLLAAAALALGELRDEAAGGWLGAAETSLDRMPAGRELPSRLAAGLVRLALSRRSGDLRGALAGAARAQAAFGQLPAGLRSRHPAAAAQLRAGQGAVELWSGELDTAAGSFAAAAAAAPDGSWERVASHGQLALAEALRGRLDEAAGLATELATGPDSGPAASPAGHGPGASPAAAAVALALVHLERHEPAAGQSWLRQAEAALQAGPDRLLSALACLAAARSAVAHDQGPAAAAWLRQARDGWSPPPWLDHQLSLAAAQASLATGDIPAALRATRQAGGGPAAAVTLTHVHLAAGDGPAAEQALAGAGDPPPGEAGQALRVDICLAGARLAYRRGDPARGRRSLEQALRLARPQRRRLAFVLHRAWIQPALRGCPELAATYHALMQPGSRAAGQAGPGRAARRLDPVVVERLSDREREVLQFAAALLSTDEIAREMYLSSNTVKTHLRSIFRKLGATRRGEAVRRARQLGLL